MVSTRKRADEYRANAEADHFNRDHTLQLQTGQGGNRNYLAWDTNNDDDTKLHVARYRKTESDWDELLAQVCSSPMKEKDSCSSLFAMMIVYVPPFMFLSFFFFPYKTRDLK